MFDNFLIRTDSLVNIVEDGEVVGFSLGVRNANYRGCYLSLHNGYFLRVDGEEYARDVQTFVINNRPPRTFEAIANAVWEHWSFDDEGVLRVAKPGGLASGWHGVELQQSILAAYGYHATDEEWVRHPPAPGRGVGSDKTPVVVKYRLKLTEPGA